MVIVDSPRWATPVEELEREAGLSEGDLILQVPVSVESGQLVAIRRNGESLPLRKYFALTGVSVTRPAFLWTCHSWCYALLEQELRDGNLAGRVHGIFLDSTLVLHSNDPAMKAAYRERHLPHVMQLGYVDLRGSIPESFESTIAGVVWLPDDYDRHTRRDLATQASAHKNLVYCLPHELSYIADADRCLEADLVALYDAGIALESVVPIAPAGKEKLWNDRVRERRSGAD